MDVFFFSCTFSPTSSRKKPEFFQASKTVTFLAAYGQLISSKPLVSFSYSFPSGVASKNGKSL